MAALMGGDGGAESVFTQNIPGLGDIYGIEQNAGTPQQTQTISGLVREERAGTGVDVTREARLGRVETMKKEATIKNRINELVGIDKGAKAWDRNDGLEGTSLASLPSQLGLDSLPIDIRGEVWLELEGIAKGKYPTMEMAEEARDSVLKRHDFNSMKTINAEMKKMFAADPNKSNTGYQVMDDRGPWKRKGMVDISEEVALARAANSILEDGVDSIEYNDLLAYLERYGVAMDQIERFLSETSRQQLDAYRAMLGTETPKKPDTGLGGY